MTSSDLVASLLKGTPCRTTLGHGESCVEGWLCSGCTWRRKAATHIRKLEAERDALRESNERLRELLGCVKINVIRNGLPIWLTEELDAALAGEKR